MKYTIIGLSVLVLFGATGAMCERIQEDLALPPAQDLDAPASEDTSQIKTAVLRGEERFVDSPSAGTAASWGMEVLLAVLSVATGGLGMTQLRDRNARRRVETQTQELQRLVTAIQAVIAQNPSVSDWLSGLGLAPPVAPTPLAAPSLPEWALSEGAARANSGEAARAAASAPVPDQAGGGGAA